MKRDLTLKMERNSVLESVVTQMTVQNLKLNGRLAEMDHKLEATSAEIERQSKQIEGLRAENEELLDKMAGSKMDDIQHDEEMKELLDQCIQCTIEIEDIEPTETETEEKGISCCGGPGDDEEEEEDEEGEDLLTLVRQYENHEEYLNESKEEEDQMEDEMKEEEEEKESKVIHRDDLIAELLKEGLQREMEKNKKNGTSGLRKKGFWEFLTSRIDSAMYWR